MTFDRTNATLVSTSVVAVMLVLMTAGVTQAQSGNETHWGIRATVAPSWEIPQRLMEVDFLQDYFGQGSEVKGSELALGFVRGRRLGGDWGLAYLRKTLSDSTRIDISNGDTCISVGAALQCGGNRDVYTTSGVAFNGLELHKFVSWYTIKRRAQIGMNLGIGAIMISGGTVTKDTTTTSIRFDPVTRQNSLTTAQSTTTLDGKGFLEDLGVPSILPVAKVEFALTGILARNFKVRASGGVNLPGVQKFSITAFYLFGN